ncbi:kynureninase [Chryseolinea sp. T2]|uniref:kynureninase n=1 Tax=Chryseolinea sp. T2 TaxID=3129255 RepID=UPI0030776E51
MKFEDSLKFARQLDRTDPLRSYRSSFKIPKIKGKNSVYFTGNSLGLQPQSTSQYIRQELDDWANLGVEGHFHAKRPWLYYHRLAKKSLARLTGARPSEVVAMNQLTVNLHLMMASFYQPTKSRFRIIAEAGAFSSDQYALETQLKWHGLDPSNALVEISPRAGENTLRTSDIVNTIIKNGDSLALVLLGGIQYYTGQFFDIKKITAAAHNVGAIAGFDLAHAIGNVPLSLHRDNVDFAVWCSYKYLNAGPGALAGAYVHEKYAHDRTLPRLAGWWGHDEGERFQMKKGFIPMPGADGWQVSNVPIFQAAALLSALELFDNAGMSALRKKSVQLTGYLEYWLQKINADNRYFSIITPDDPKQRGCQLSIFMKGHGKKISDALLRNGIITDWREPNVIRAAPVPFYNTYEDVYVFATTFKKEIDKLKW